MENNYKIALLIDAENVQVDYVEAVMKELASYGKIMVARFYGDVNITSKKWIETAINYAIKPMHQNNVSSGKNAADMALSLDAMEIMYQDRVNMFAIVSSDSDFTPLSIKLKEGGMYVVGFGNEAKVTKAFKASCSEFKYFELLDTGSNDEEETNSVEDNHKDDDITDIIKEIIVNNAENNMMLLSEVGIILKNRYSDFDTRKYGFNSLSSLTRSLSGIKTIKEKGVYYVKIDPLTSFEEIAQFIEQAIGKNKSRKMKLNKLVQLIKSKYKKFNYKDYGYSRFKNFLNSLEHIEVTEDTAILKI